ANRGGLEPSCLFTLRDEFKAMLPGAETDLVAEHALLFEEFIAREQKAGKIAANFKPVAKKALVHGHCHQKAFAAMGAVESALRLVPGMEVEVINSSCCGMAGAFGYEKKNLEVSIAMAERDLLPAVRAADGDTVLVADGTSCRHQIKDGAAREAVHVATILDRALA
ncbi:MAG: FAD-binding oxidoreductase, partial [Nisaea sp.]|nr:FAD-binding oxidoreductase [Nisaea sp.]